MQTVEEAQTSLGTGEDETIDEAAMDELFREILAAPPSPSLAAPSLMCDEGEVPRHEPTMGDMNTDADADEVQREMQRLLDLATPELTLDALTSEDSDITPLELELGAWEASMGLPQPVF